jgi:prophage regulatory protein
LTSPATQENLSPRNVRILRLPDVIARVGLPRASIYQLMAQGAFPKPIPLSARARGWIESEVEAWIKARISARVPA